MKVAVMILGLALAILWGGIQPTIFPPDTYGLLFILTSFMGGACIGYVTLEIIDELDNDY